MGEKHIPQNPADGSSERYDKVRESIGALLSAGLWVFIDLTFVWPDSHERAILFGVGYVALQCIQVLPSHRAAAIGFGATVASGLVLYILVPPTPLPETPQHGLLTPGNEPMPPIPSSCADLPSKWVGWRVYAGNSGAVFIRTKDVPSSVFTALPFLFNRLPILTVKGQDKLWVEKTQQGVAISGEVFDKNGAVVRLDRNEFTRSEANSFRRERPDSHTLVVYDRFDNPVLTVKYFNPEAIYLTGTFWYPEQTSQAPMLEITDDFFRCDGSPRFEQGCFTNVGTICMVG
jgi:hypothetical protein